VAWNKGIVVVAAAGNAGFALLGSMTNPATDPYVVAVGASDTHGTATMLDDTVASFSSSSNWGTNGSFRLVDLVAPGSHVVSLRDPGSYVDQNYGSTGGVTSSLFRGSGTSQAAAVVSGAAALILQQRPTLNPNEVKRLLTYSATQIQAQAVEQGNGELNLAAGIDWPTSFVAGFLPYNLTPGNGTGTLEGSRGSNHLVKDGVSLKGEKDIFGKSFKSSSMATAEASASSWSGGTWNGSSWSGSSWSGSSWSGSSWSGSSWSGSSWSATQWSGSSWSGSSWSGSSWSSNNWLGGNWAESAWSDASWN
jgi:serine protease AprX